MKPRSHPHTILIRDSSDFWALGCIIYQMIAGRFVFRGLSDWQKIKQLEYTFPDGFDEQAQDLVKKLLVSFGLHLIHTIAQ